MSVPKVGKTVQVTCDGRDLLGTVVHDVVERSIILQAPSGRLFVVPVKGSTFQVEGEQDIPLPPEPPEHDG